MLVGRLLLADVTGDMFEVGVVYFARLLAESSLIFGQELQECRWRRRVAQLHPVPRFRSRSLQQNVHAIFRRHACVELRAQPHHVVVEVQCRLVEMLSPCVQSFAQQFLPAVVGTEVVEELVDESWPASQLLLVVDVPELRGAVEVHGRRPEPKFVCRTREFALLDEIPQPLARVGSLFAAELGHLFSVAKGDEHLRLE